ncbi:MAG: Peptidyl-tRNA hydrolase [Berkelbacteria bacterium GW2011_GWB1_38_5]|uniref:Peptidyl-tRNA hydrolase n=2 Tax=Candidatus Berkelbacteria TaxID=1618330 RepID=A0A0G0PN43_9BACT|nr:MAG: Peptidyl-tRNA hydrolase [Berkelbacteria bacterium GW2011_GWB1_38_5]KKQ90716.1 MAG: Peptidyl-tRNA hydrolase [Berkelbacteria bacterium GW2011_GWA1_39_10]
MKLIIGLGNPGKKYINSRHNTGFKIIEKTAEKRGVVFRLEPHYKSRFAEMGDLENRIKLAMPQTFMNESGQAVKISKNYWKVDSEDIWVVHDDVDLALGTIRISLGGSSAGHKGIQSIIDNIGEAFWRVRVGVGKDEKIPTEEWVLMNFSKNDQENVDNIIDKVSDLVLDSLSKDLEEKTIII